jgi:hypothetical protein
MDESSRAPASAPSAKAAPATVKDNDPLYMNIILECADIWLFATDIPYLFRPCLRPGLSRFALPSVRLVPDESQKK